MKMQKWIMIVVSIFLLSCTAEQSDFFQNSANSKPETQISAEQQDANHIQQVEITEFNNIKREIDYWYDQGPGHIGKEHHDQLWTRLDALKQTPLADIEIYRQKLDAIVLVEEIQNTNNPEPTAERQQNTQSTQCSGQGNVTFTSPPMRIADIAFIEPLGLMIGGHVTPIDHGYYTARTWKPGTAREDPSIFVDILAPAAGVVTELSSMPTEYASSSIGDYRFEIKHTCSFKTIYIHVNQLSEKLQKAVETRNTVNVEAGEIIGKAPGFDFSVHDEDVTLKGFIIPAHYDVEPWKIHTVDMFNYFTEPIKTQLLDKNIRQKEPRSGKIDYDIDGKLVGNWFEENTNAYFGKEEYQRMTGYWSTHLAFAYDGLDPSLLIISIGNFSNEAKQFAVKGNAPDPARISATNGQIKYELVNFEYKTAEGKYWNRISFAKVTSAEEGKEIFGTVLVQMIDTRKIKFEVFPGKSASQITGFTNNAKIYER